MKIICNNAKLQIIQFTNKDNYITNIKFNHPVVINNKTEVTVYIIKQPPIENKTKKNNKPKLIISRLTKKSTNVNTNKHLEFEYITINTQLDQYIYKYPDVPKEAIKKETIIQIKKETIIQLVKPIYYRNIYYEDFLVLNKEILDLYFNVSDSDTESAKENVLVLHNEHDTSKVTKSSLSNINCFYCKQPKEAKESNSLNNKRRNSVIKIYNITLTNKIYRFKNPIKSTKYIVIYFPNESIGEYDKIFSYTKQQIENNIISNYKDLHELIMYIISFISNEENLNTKILLSGHSYGMTFATYFSYILYILSSHTEADIINNNLIKHMDIMLLTILESKIIEFLTSIKDKLQNSIYICGTGGIPNLFENEEEFNKFNEFYKHKYIHIISANTLLNTYSKNNLFNNKNQDINQQANQDINQQASISIDLNAMEKTQYKTANTKPYKFANYGSIIINSISTNKNKLFFQYELLNYNDFDNVTLPYIMNKETSTEETSTEETSTDNTNSKKTSLDTYKDLYKKYMYPNIHDKNNNV